MDRASLIFCAFSIVITLAISTLGYPFAVVDADKLSQWRTPANAEALPDVNMGEFGTVSVSELVEYYMENPPAQPVPGAGSAREVRFQGC